MSTTIAVSHLLLLHPDDNVLVVAIRLEAGDSVLIDGRSHTIRNNIDVGHKVARSGMDAGTKVVRYGAAIGSLTAPVRAGDHVHTHNLKSDYIASHSRQAAQLGDFEHD